MTLIAAAHIDSDDLEGLPARFAAPLDLTAGQSRALAIVGSSGSAIVGVTSAGAWAEVHYSAARSLVRLGLAKIVGRAGWRTCSLTPAGLEAWLTQGAPHP